MAKWKWEELRHTNYRGPSPRYTADCQVVSAVNAYHVLTGKRAFKTEREYVQLCRMAGAIAGPATSIERVYDKLGLERFQPEFYPYETLHGVSPYPVELCVWHSHYGFHSILIVDRVPKCGAVRVVNFSRATNPQGWMFESELFHYITHPPTNKPGQDKMHRCWRVRTQP